MGRMDRLAIMCCLGVSLSRCGFMDSASDVSSYNRYGAPQKPFIEVVYDGLDGVNLRAEPSANSAKVGEALFRQRFEFLAVETTKAPEPLDRWIQIRTHDGTKAWIAEYLTNYTTALLSRVRVQTADGGTAKLRHGPGITYVTEGEVANGTYLTVLGERTDDRRRPLNRWLQVKTSKGNITWIASFLTSYPSPTMSPSRRKSSGSAFLSVIATAEGTGNRYDYSYSFKRFYSYKGHPRVVYCGGGWCSDAAGRYQFLSRTWDEIHPVMRLNDFSPASQDAAALYLLRTKDILPNGIRTYAQFRSAIHTVRNTWSSLPGSTNKQPIPYTLDQLWSKFQEFVTSP